MKKYIAILLALVCLLSGCSGAPAETTPATTVTPTTEPAPQPVGTLYVAFGAALEMVYDNAGNALSITGVNETGKILAEAKQDYLGRGCVYALRAILRHAITNDLVGDTKTVTIRIGVNDPLPTEDFLLTIGQDCQYLIDEEVSGMDLYALTGELVDETGNLTYDMAAKLAATYLGADAADLTGAETPTDGLYTFASSEKACTVDAFNGLVSPAA